MGGAVVLGWLLGYRTREPEESMSLPRRAVKDTADLPCPRDGLMLEEVSGIVKIIQLKLFISETLRANPRDLRLTSISSFTRREKKIYCQGKRSTVGQLPSLFKLGKTNSKYKMKLLDQPIVDEHREKQPHLETSWHKACLTFCN